MTLAKILITGSLLLLSGCSVNPVQETQEEQELLQTCTELDGTCAHAVLPETH